MPVYLGPKGCLVSPPTLASGATPMARLAFSLAPWTTRRARSATCMRVSGCSRWTSCGGRPGADSGDQGRRPSGGRQVHSHRWASTGKPRAAPRAVAVGAEAARGLRRGGQLLSREPGSPARVPLSRRTARNRGSPADSLVIGKIEAYQLSQNYKIKLLRARLSGKLRSRTGKLGCFPAFKTRRSRYDPASEKRHSRKG